MMHILILPFAEKIGKLGKVLVTQSCPTLSITWKYLLYSFVHHVHRFKGNCLNINLFIK